MRGPWFLGVLFNDFFFLLILSFMQPNLFNLYQNKEKIIMDSTINKIPYIVDRFISMGYCYGIPCFLISCLEHVIDIHKTANYEDKYSLCFHISNRLFPRHHEVLAGSVSMCTCLVDAFKKTHAVSSHIGNLLIHPPNIGNTTCLLWLSIVA